MKGAGDEIIIEHYKKVAKDHGLAATSSMKDQVIRNAEVDFFVKTVASLFKPEAQQSLLDIGCGNGHLLATLREQFPALKLFGAK